MNKVIVYDGIAGLHCECGNSESLDTRGTYHTFATSAGHLTGKMRLMARCLKCNNQLDDIENRRAPAELHAELLAKFGPPKAAS